VDYSIIILDMGGYMNQDQRHSKAKEYLNRSLEDLLSELGTHVPRIRGEKKSKHNFWKSIEPVLRQRVCIDWKWCHQREKLNFQNLEDLVVVLAEALTGLVIPSSIPLMLIASILVKIGVDKFCQCEKLSNKKDWKSFKKIKYEDKVS